MSEKQFTLVKKGNDWVVDDNSRKKFYLTPNEVVKLLNEQQSIIKYLTIEKHQADKRFQTIIAELKKENEQLRKQCFELEKDYLIETSDISDKIYLDDEIRELKQRYGV